MLQYLTYLRKRQHLFQQTSQVEVELRCLLYQKFLIYSIDVADFVAVEVVAAAVVAGAVVGVAIEVARAVVELAFVARHFCFVVIEQPVMLVSVAVVVVAAAVDVVILLVVG